MTIYQALQDIELQQCRFNEGRSVLDALLDATAHTDIPMTTETMRQFNELTNAALTLWGDVPEVLTNAGTVLADIVHLRVKGKKYEQEPLKPEQQDLIRRIATIPPHDAKAAYKRILWALEGWE